MIQSAISSDNNEATATAFIKTFSSQAELSYVLHFYVSQAPTLTATVNNGVLTLMG